VELLIENILLIIVAYLIGSIPFSVLVGKIFYGIDVREFGSGNAGATNTFRVLGKKAGIPVLILDVLKGTVAVWMSFLINETLTTEQELVNFQLVLGVAALLGHIFPVYVGFRGGKGIATLLGIMLAIHPSAAGLSALVFILIFVVFRIVSLSSIIAAISFPLIVIFIFTTGVKSLVIFSIFIAVIVVFTHQKNIERLLRNEEAKLSFSSKKRQDTDIDFDDDDFDDDE
jgi:acyl phosphate:glycerol-3-phosphate acyltransferase